MFYSTGQTLDPKALYNNSYFQGAEHFDYLTAKSALQKTFAARIRHLQKFKPEGRLFEIGAAYGFFLELASRHWQVRGIDIAQDAVTFAREQLSLDVASGDFLHLEGEDEVYDIICMWDTIEHLENPIAYIEKASRWLKPGGILALTTGDIDSLVARARKQHWRLIHPPTHLFYFSENTLKQALERFDLHVIHCSHVGYHRGLKAMAHGLFEVPDQNRRWLNRILALGGSKDVSIYLNLFDILYVVAQKTR